MHVKIILLLIIFSNLKSVKLIPSVSAFQTYLLENNLLENNLLENNLLENKKDTRQCKDKSGNPLPWRHFNDVTNVGVGIYENKSGYLCCDSPDCANLNVSSHKYGKCNIKSDNTQVDKNNCYQNAVCYGRPLEGIDESAINDDDVPRCNYFETRQSINDCIKNNLGFDFIYLTKMGYCCDNQSGKDGHAGCVQGYLRDDEGKGSVATDAKCKLKGHKCQCGSGEDDQNSGYCYLDRGNSRGVFLLGLPGISDNITNYQKVDKNNFSSFTKNPNIHAEDGLKDIEKFMKHDRPETFTFSYGRAGKKFGQILQYGDADGEGSGCNAKTDGKYPDKLEGDNPVECANGETKIWPKLKTIGVGNWYNVAAGSNPIFTAERFCKPINVISNSPITQKNFMEQFKKLFSEIPKKGFKKIFEELRPYQIGTLLEISNQKRPIKSICDLPASDDNKNQAVDAQADGKAKPNQPTGLESRDCSFLISSFFKNYCSSVNGNLITFCSDSEGKDCSLTLSEDIEGDNDNSYTSAFFALVNDGLIPFAYGADTVYGFYSYLIYYLLEKLKNSPEVESTYKALVAAFQAKYKEYFNITSAPEGTADMAKDFQADKVKYASLSSLDKSQFALEVLQLIKASLKFKPDALTTILWENSQDYSRVAAAAPTKGGIPDEYLDIRNHTMDVAYLVKALIFFFNNVTIFAESAQVGLLPTTAWEEYLQEKVKK